MENIRIGNSVSSIVDPFGSGIVFAIDGGPNGSHLYRVRKPGQNQSMSYQAHDLVAGPALREFSIGDHVHLHAAIGVVTDKTSDTYDVKIIRHYDGSLFEFEHRYTVAAWQLQLEDP